MTQQHAATALLQVALRRRLLSMKEALSLRHVLAGCDAHPQAIRERLAHNPAQVSAETVQALRDLLPTPSQEIINNYRRLALLGRGASGETWLGVGDHGLTVLKTLDAELVPNAHEFITTLAPLIGGDHHYLVNYIAIESSSDGAVTIIQHYRSGRDAAERFLIKGEASEARALTIMRHAAKGLAQLHHLQVTHGNLKLQNLLLDSDGSVALSDFACATSTHGPRPAWTPQRLQQMAFAAPETGAAKPYYGPAADIYALGCIGYWLLCGEPPFPGTPERQALQHAGADRPDVRIKAPGVSDITAKTLLKAMQIDPAARYTTARAFVHSLERNLELLERPQNSNQKEQQINEGVSSLMLSEPD